MTAVATVVAPFIADQVVSLNGFQRAGVMHPFTCPDRGDHRHVWRAGDADLGVLVASVDGWRCEQCDYTQDWAYGFMADWSWRGTWEAGTIAWIDRFLRGGGNP